MDVGGYDSMGGFNEMNVLDEHDAEGMTSIAALFCTICQQLKDEPWLQAVFLASALYTLKNNNGMSEKVDFAISYNGKILRLEDMQKNNR